MTMADTVSTTDFWLYILSDSVGIDFVSPIPCHGLIFKAKETNYLQVNLQSLLSLLCDSVGTRTQDLLLRRQLLYPAELRNPTLRKMRVQS